MGFSGESLFSHSSCATISSVTDGTMDIPK
jgi:hypothetical protein